MPYPPAINQGKCRLEPIIAFLHQIRDRLFRCRHRRLPMHEGKCYCPDCGQGVIFQWVVLRCRSCRIRRESCYYLYRIIPMQACCPACGNEDNTVETLENPSYFHLQKAVLIRRDTLLQPLPGIVPVLAWIEKYAILNNSLPKPALLPGT